MGGNPRLCTWTGRAGAHRRRTTGRAGWQHLLTTLVATAALIAGATACSGGRSTEAFCDTLRSEKQRILAQFESTSQLGAGDEFAEALMGLGASAQAIGELQTYFRKLADVAPEEIRVEAEIVAENMGELVTGTELSLEGIAGSLMTGLSISGQLNTINQFALENCGESV